MVDGLGEPVAPYYSVKNSYSSVLCYASLTEIDFAPGEEIVIPARVINETGEKVCGTVTVDIFTLDLKKCHSEKAKVCAENYLTDALSVSFKIPEEWADKDFFVRTALENQNGIVSSCFYPLKCLTIMSDDAFRANWREEMHPNLIMEKGPFIREQIENSAKAELCVELLNAEMQGNRHKAKVRITCKNAPAYPISVQVINDKTVSMLSDNWFFMDKDEERVIDIETRIKEDIPANITLCVKAWNSSKTLTELSTKCTKN